MQQELKEHGAGAQKTLATLLDTLSILPDRRELFKLFMSAALIDASTSDVKVMHCRCQYTLESAMANRQFF